MASPRLCHFRLNVLAWLWCDVITHIQLQDPGTQCGCFQPATLENLPAVFYAFGCYYVIYFWRYQHVLIKPGFTSRGICSHSYFGDDFWWGWRGSKWRTGYRQRHRVMWENLERYLTIYNLMVHLCLVRGSFNGDTLLWIHVFSSRKEKYGDTDSGTTAVSFTFPLSQIFNLVV